MRERVLTSLLLAPIVLAILFLANPWPLAILAALICAQCIRESLHLLPSGSWARPVTLAGFPIACAAALFAAHPRYVAAALMLCSLIGWAAAYNSPKVSFGKVVLLDLASLWYSVPLAACLVLHGSHPAEVWNFRSPLLLALLPVWAGDVAAIFAGKAFGKHLLAPKLSPKKTVEGGIANLVAAAAAGAGFGVLVGFSWQVATACGLCAGILGQAGDLFESYLKRRAGVKDSGSLLPGHGGILDRIDSLLFTASAIALIVTSFR